MRIHICNKNPSPHHIHLHTIFTSISTPHAHTYILLPHP
jgi:hypothetical protein